MEVIHRAARPSEPRRGTAPVCGVVSRDEAASRGPNAVASRCETNERVGAIRTRLSGPQIAAGESVGRDEGAREGATGVVPYRSGDGCQPLHGQIDPRGDRVI